MFIHFSSIMIKFSCPSTIILSGCTCSGKSTFVQKMLDNLDIFTVPPKKIFYFYGVYSPQYRDRENVEYIQGLPDDFKEYSNINEHRLIVLDDLQAEAASSKAVESLFTRDAHHKNLSVCLLNQNLFYQGKFCRTIALNAHVIILFKNPRANSQIKILQNQIGLKHIAEAYNDVISSPYGYLVIDLSPGSEQKYMLRTHVFQGEYPVIYS